MTKTYLKRIAAPKTWPILRKTGAFITRPKPSGHRLEHTLPVTAILRDYLGLVRSARQAGTVLKTTEISVNGRRVRNGADSAGFMDVVAIGKDSYRILLDKNENLTVTPVQKGEEHVVRKIIGVTTLKGGKAQVNLSGGDNLLAEKHGYKVGDSLVFKDGKVTAHLPLGKGASALIVGGSHIGELGTIESVEGDVVTIKADNAFTTTKAYVYVIGKEKPLITIG